MEVTRKLTEEEGKLETAFTGRKWKDCERCSKVRITVEQNPSYCSNCGGEIVNCRTCGTGKNWWFAGPKCSICGGNPLKKDDGRSDHALYHRARMVNMFGVRRDGDVKLLERYKDELAKYN